MDSTIAITGASGLIGRALCEHFSRRGWQVRALTRRADSALASLPGVSVCDCDLPDRIDAASLAGCSAVIHAAYVTRFRTLAEAQRVNETGTRRLLETSRQADVPRFVFVSTTSAHAAAKSYYGQSKFRLEGALDPDRDLVIRPGLVVSERGGLFQRLVGQRKAKRWTVPLFGGGKQPLQTIHLDDLCQGFGLAIERGLTGAVTLASPERTSYRDFFEAVATLLHRRAHFVRVPIGPAIAALRIAERLGVRLPVSSENLLGLVGLRFWDSQPDLHRVGLKVRSMNEALGAAVRSLNG